MESFPKHVFLSILNYCNKNDFLIIILCLIYFNLIYYLSYVTKIKNEKIMILFILDIMFFEG